MTNPGDSSDQIPGQGGQAPSPRNVAREGPSGSAPVPREEGAGSSRPSVAGRGTSSTIFPGPVNVGEPTVGGSSAVGGGGSGGVAALQIGAGGGGISQRKRTREGDAGAGPSRPVQDNPPPPPLLPPAEVARPFVCSVPECRRQFRTDRALCGHMRTHERAWRGAFPPPTFSREEFYDDGVGDLLNPPLEGPGEEEAAFVDPGVEMPEIVEEGEIIADPGEQARDDRNEPAATGILSEAEEAILLPAEMEVKSPLDLNAVAAGEEEPPPAEAEASTSEKPKIPDLNKKPPQDDRGNYM